MMILIDARHQVYTLAPGDSLEYDLSDDGLGEQLQLVQRDGASQHLMTLAAEETDAFKLRLKSCLKKGRKEGVAVIDLEAVRVGELEDEVKPKSKK